MTSIDFSTRLASAHRYHEFLAKNQFASWLEALGSIEGNPSAGIPEVMVLLHPKWHSELGFQVKSDPRGLTSFSAASQRAKCRSLELWGYVCPYQDSQIHIDHTFPYARGGATKDDNAMYLCREHNLSKSTDLHLVPWESLPEKVWVMDELKVLLRMGQRLTSQDLYLPLKAIQKS